MAQSIKRAALRRGDPAREEARQELLRSLAHTRTLINQAYGGFNTASDNDLIEFEIESGAVRYGWRELPQENGQPLWQVRAEVITGPSLFVITVTHLEPEDRPGIVELVRKITVQTQDVEKQTIQADK